MLIKISEIRENKGRRLADTTKVEELAESIEQIGLINPITVAERDNKYILVAGLHRLEAHKLLDRDKIEVSIFTGTDLELELAEIDENLVRNELHYTELDDLMLRKKQIYEEIYPDTKVGVAQAKGMNTKIGNVSEIISPTRKPSFSEDTAIKTGQSERNIQLSTQRAENLIPEAKPILREKDITKTEATTLARQEPEVQKRIIDYIKSSSGDISINKAYTNIKNQEKKEELKARAEEVAQEFEKDDLVEIIHDDCTGYLKTLEDNSIDLILLDPPYFGIVQDDWDNQWKSREDFLSWCKEWMIECLRVLKDTGNFYIWGQVGEKSDILIHQKLLLDSLGFHFKDWITWKKRRGLGNRKGWLYTREECLWYVKDNSQFYWNEDEQYSNEKSSFKQGFSGYELKSENKRITNVWDDIPEFIGNKGILHYTPKPLEGIERIIKSSTKEGELVLDVFAGSGTTGIASRNLNRKCILVEKDINSINEIKRRLIDEL